MIFIYLTYYSLFVEQYLFRDLASFTHETAFSLAQT